MVNRTSSFLAAIALGAMALGGLLPAGCKPEEPAAVPPTPAPQADPPSVYMNDPAFRKAIGDQNSERNQILSRRETVLTRIEGMIEGMRAKMPGADDAAVREALEKDPEWQSLVGRLKEINEAFEDNRKATTKIVGDRIGPKQPKPEK